MRVQTWRIDRLSQARTDPAAHRRMSEEISQALHVTRDRHPAPVWPAGEVLRHVIERGVVPRPSSPGEPREEWRERTPQTVQRRDSQASFVAQRPHQIIERLVTGNASAGGKRGTRGVADTAMRNGGSEPSVLMVKHDRTSSWKVVRLRSIADAYVR
jgi:hypothetical protein